LSPFAFIANVTVDLKLLIAIAEHIIDGVFPAYLQGGPHVYQAKTSFYSDICKICTTSVSVHGLQIA